jgi:hypothetical protein
MILIDPIHFDPIDIDTVRSARCGPDFSSTIQQQGSTP